MYGPRLCTADDIYPWMQLAHEVEHLFGPMPDLRAHIHRGIRRGTAVVIVKSGSVIGAMLLSGPGKPQYIRWLAVHPNYRNLGAGTALVKSALCHWPCGDISVVTFPENHIGGRAARRLYQQNGFVSRGSTEPAPDGSPRELFVFSR